MSDTRPPLLFLAHRIPYPPNKGDKVRSFNVLVYLAQFFQIHLVAFYDDPADASHATVLPQWCHTHYLEYRGARWGRLLSLSGFLHHEALSVAFYRSARMRAWIERQVAQYQIERVFIFSGPMAQYLSAVTSQQPQVVLDFCDVDSHKWSQYAQTLHWPLSWLYRREAKQLAQFECRMAQQVDSSVFVTAQERDLFVAEVARGAQQSVENRLQVVQNGVDLNYFSPTHTFASPYHGNAAVIVFTGAMNYWPNVDAVTWFADAVLPSLRVRLPTVRFAIVGMNPAAEVLALRSDTVIVTGKVDDIRPWLQHADVVIAPLRIARGIQNKVLEAMAMAKPVLLSRAAAQGLMDADAMPCWLEADHEDAYIDNIIKLLSDTALHAQLSRNARTLVDRYYSWPAHLAPLAELLQAAPQANAVDGDREG